MSEDFRSNVRKLIFICVGLMLLLISYSYLVLGIYEDLFEIVFPFTTVGYMLNYKINSNYNAVVIRSI